MAGEQGLDRGIGGRGSSERARLLQILDELPVWVVLLSQERRVAFANKLFVDTFGPPPHDAPLCYEYCFGFEEPCAFCELMRVFETGAPHDWECVVGERIVEVHDLPFVDVDGSRLVLEMDIDVTEARQAQRALLESEERSRRQAEHAEALNRINETLLSALTADDMLERIVVETSRVLDAEKAIMADVEGDDLVVKHVAGFPAEMVGARFPLAVFPAVQSAVLSGQPAFVEDAGESEAANRVFAERYGDGAFMTVPLAVGGRVVGAMSYVYDHPKRFDEQDAEFGRRLSVALELALESARYFEVEHDIADRLQEALLAMPDDVRGVEFAHAYHSATEAARVGGDFYDLFELDDDHVGIVIGDVAGKGIDAAVLTSMVKHTIRAYASERGKTPKQILDLTNGVLFRATPSESFVTVLLGILDCRDGRLVYANAGHTTAALLSVEGESAKLSVTGPLLGAFPDAAFAEAEAWLDHDKLLFLYTDGLTEARSEGELYGEERLFEFLRRTNAGSALDVVREAVDDVVAYSGGRLRDDLAILALKRVAQGMGTPQPQKLDMGVTEGERRDA